MLQKPLYLLWAYPAPTCRHLGHQKSIPMPTHGRTFKFLFILIDLGCSWGVQGWTHEPPFSSNFRLCPTLGTPGGHRVAKGPHGHQNDIKMDPETNKMTRKSTPRVTKQLHNKLENARFGNSLACTRSPKDPRGHQNDIKMHPDLRPPT